MENSACLLENYPAAFQNLQRKQLYKILPGGGGFLVFGGIYMIDQEKVQLEYTDGDTEL